MNAAQATKMTERLIYAAVEYENAEGIYSRSCRKELFEARAAIEQALMNSGSSGPGKAGGGQAASGGGESAEKVSELAACSLADGLTDADLKRSEILSFDDGILTVKVAGHGRKNGWGSLAFHERQFEIDAEDFYSVEIPPSELREMRDFLTRVCAQISDANDAKND